MIRLTAALMGSLLFALAIAPTAGAQDEFPEPPPPLEGVEDIEEFIPEGTFPQLESPFAGRDGEMTGERLGDLIKRVDPSSRKLGNGYMFKIEDRDMRIVYDERADRMRIITPIIPVSNLPEGLLLRMLQANFDSALDARYAVGSGNVWSSFVHRLSSLTDEDFISGVSQTAVAANTFGSTFSSGAVVFGGGDSQGLNDELVERLRQAIEDGEDDRGI